MVVHPFGDLLQWQQLFPLPLPLPNAVCKDQLVRMQARNSTVVFIATISLVVDDDDDGIIIIISNIN